MKETTRINFHQYHLTKKKNSRFWFRLHFSIQEYHKSRFGKQSRNIFLYLTESASRGMGEPTSAVYLLDQTVGDGCDGWHTAHCSWILVLQQGCRRRPLFGRNSGLQADKAFECQRRESLASDGRVELLEWPGEPPWELLGCHRDRFGVRRPLGPWQAGSIGLGSPGGLRNMLQMNKNKQGKMRIMNWILVLWKWYGVKWRGVRSKAKLYTCPSWKINCLGKNILTHDLSIGWTIFTCRGLLTPSKAFGKFCMVYLAVWDHVWFVQLLDCGETVLADSGWCRIDPKSVEVVVVVVVVRLRLRKWGAFGVVGYRYSPPSLMSCGEIAGVRCVANR